MQTEDRREAKKKDAQAYKERFEFGNHHPYHSLSFSGLDTFVTVNKIFMLE